MLSAEFRRFLPVRLEKVEACKLLLYKTVFNTDNNKNSAL